MTCSLRPDLWVPGGGGRRQKAESGCPLPTPLSTAISHKPASCSHSHTHSHSLTDPHPHTHAQTYLQTSPQVHQQNTGPHPYPIRHPGRVQAIRAGPQYTYTPGETHVAVLQRTLSGRGLGLSPSLMPPGSLGVGPLECSGDRALLLHGTQRPEPALSHSGQRNQQLWPRISSKVPLPALPREPAPPREPGAHVHRYGCAGARSVVCGGAPGGEAVSPLDSFSSSFHDTPMAPGAPRMRQLENTGGCPPSPGMHTLSGPSQARLDF